MVALIPPPSEPGQFLAFRRLSSGPTVPVGLDPVQGSCNIPTRDELDNRCVGTVRRKLQAVQGRADIQPEKAPEGRLRQSARSNLLTSSGSRPRSGNA
jgi:hypothetical protein